MKDAMVFSLLFVGCFALTALISRYLIPFLKSKKMGQKILDIGPRWHKSKEGTPTMGGLAFLIPATVLGAGFCVWYAVAMGKGTDVCGMALTLALALANGCIGILDDMTKFKKAQNEGLTPPQKFLLQLAFAALYLFGMSRFGLIHTTVTLPLFDVTFDIGILYYALSLILITGIVNSVNLTDGIDGLCSMVTLIVGLFFFACGMRDGVLPRSALGGILCGSCGGFLVYNYYPARVFMGDTGSLFLGGLVAGGAFLLDRPFLVLLAGIIYLCESFSVIIQVTCFKLTGKRVFRMAPIHHHFEKCGWSEIRIDYVFSAVTAIFCAAVYFLMML